MTDDPLLFRNDLGALRPDSPAAVDAMQAFKQGKTLRIEIKRTRGNIGRLRWYWAMLRLALDNLGDRFDGTVTPVMLHKWLKIRFGLSKPVRSKRNNEIIGYDEGSIAFHRLPESERAPFIEWAVEFLAEQLGTDPATLKNEAHRVS